MKGRSDEQRGGVLAQVRDALPALALLRAGYPHDAVARLARELDLDLERRII